MEFNFVLCICMLYFFADECDAWWAGETRLKLKNYLNVKFSPMNYQRGIPLHVSTSPNIDPASRPERDVADPSTSSKDCSLPLARL